MPESHDETNERPLDLLLVDDDDELREDMSFLFLDAATALVNVPIEAELARTRLQIRSGTFQSGGVF
jgi:hypothetical protein